MSPPRFTTPEAFLGDRRVRVAVAGAGGTGSMLLDGLARLDRALRNQGHPGLDCAVYDADTVSAANVGRSRFHSSDVGFNKAVILVHRLNNFYGLDWSAVPAWIDGNHSASSHDLLIGCVDKGAFRYELGKRYAGHLTNTLWLDTGNGADTGQVVLGHLGAPHRDSLRLPNIYDFYGKSLLVGDADSLPSCSLAEALTRQRWSINPLVASTAMTLLDALFHRGGLNDHGAFIRLDPISVTPISVDEEVWKLFGYAPARRKECA